MFFSLTKKEAFGGADVCTSRDWRKGWSVQGQESECVDDDLNHTYRYMFD